MRVFKGRSLPLVASLWLVLLLPTQSDGQAWTKEKGKTYIKFSYGSSTASEQYSFDGQTKEYADNVSENAFFDRSLYLYGEVGLTPKLTLVAGIPFKRVIVRDATFRYRTFALGNAVIGARYNLKSLLGVDAGSKAIAANFSLSLPTGYSRNLTPSVGAGQIDAELNASYGHSFHPFPGYAQASLGYRYRSTAYGLSSAIPCQEGVNKDCFADTKPTYEDELFGSLEGGATIASRVFLQGIARFNWALTEPTTGFTVSNPIPTKQRYLKLGAGIGVATIKDLNLSAQFFFTPTGRNTVKSTDLFLGIDYTFSAF